MIQRTITFFFLIISFPLFPQDPAATYYTTKDGLLSNNIYHVMQDSKGFIWICTDKGVSRFDGHDFKNFGKKEGLDGSNVFVSYEDYNGKIWFGSYGSNVYYFDSGKIHPFIYNDTLRKYFSEKCVKVTIQYNKKNELILGSLKHGYIRIDNNGNNITKYWSKGKNVLISGEDLINFSIRSELPPRANSVGVNIIEDNKVMTVYGSMEDQDRIRKPNFYSFYNSFDSSYIVSSHNRLYSYKNRSISLIKTFERPIDCIYVNENRELMLGFIGGGLSIYSSDNVGDSSSKYFINYTVTHILQDKVGRYFIGTLGNGLIKVNNFHLFEYSINSSYISDLKKFKEDTFYVSFSNGSIYEISKNYFFKKLQIQQVRTDVPVYFGLMKNKLILSDEFKHSKHSNDFNFLSFGSINVIPKKYMTTKDNLVYIASNARLFRFNKDELYSFPKNLALINYDLKINCLEEDNEGVIWISTNKGLFKIEESEIKKVEGYDEEVFEIISNEKGIYLNTASHGVVFVSKTDTTIIFNDKDQTLKKIGELGNTNKLFVAQGDRISLFAHGGRHLINLNHSIGISFNEVKAIKIVNSDLWLVDKNSVYLYEDFDILELKDLMYPPTISRVIVNNDYQLTHEFQDVELSFNENDLELEVDIIKKKRNFQGFFKYRLLPTQIKWRSSTTQKIVFNSLHPDSYTLQLINVEENNGLQSRISSYRFTIKHPFWRIGLSIALALFVILLSYVGQKSYKIKKSQKYIQPDEIIKEKNILKLQALFAQMNPHFTFNVLNSLQGLVLKDDRTESIFFLNKYARFLRKVLSNSNNPMVKINEEIKLLERYLDMENLRFNGKINLTVEFKNQDSLGEYMIPAMLLQPIVENSVKHGFKNSVNTKHTIIVEIFWKNNYIEFRIIDNGIGLSAAKEFEKDEDNTSIGLNIVRERLSIVNQNIGVDDYFSIDDVIENNEIKGTIVVLKFPLINE